MSTYFIFVMIKRYWSHWVNCYAILTTNSIRNKHLSFVALKLDFTGPKKKRTQLLLKVEFPLQKDWKTSDVTRFIIYFLRQNNFLSRCIIHHQIVCRKGMILAIAAKALFHSPDPPIQHHTILLNKLISSWRGFALQMSRVNSGGLQLKRAHILNYATLKPVTFQSLFRVGFATEQPLETCGREQRTCMFAFLLM